jgi:radical SAM protein with 4Fe4S-binding SPASM domain
MIACPLPWTGIAVNPDGSVRNCAMSQETLGNLKSSPVSEILNNSQNQQIRNSLKSGQWPKSCRLCEQRETVDPEFSNRAYQLKLHRDVDIDYNANHKLTQLDLRWSNTCNYACVYCGPYFSSLWAAEMGQSVNVDRTTFDQLKDYTYDKLTELREVYLAGGEPLMIKENGELLDRLYAVNPACLVRITTNLSNLKTGIYSKIKQFKNVQWEVSVEATNEAFEYIRYPGVWLEFESNLKQLIVEWPRDQIGLTMNYFLLNATTIIETGKYLIDFGVDENRVAVHYLTDPKFLDARNLNKKYLTQTVDYLNSYQAPTTFGTSLQNCSEFLTKPFDKNPVNVVKYLDAIDKRRNLNFTATFPNLLNRLI